MENGVITEQGTYEVGTVSSFNDWCTIADRISQNLIRDSVVFTRLIEEYGNLKQEEPGDGRKGKKEDVSSDDADNLDKKGDTTLMQTEERLTGAVSWSTYARYLRFAGTITWAPIILILLTLAQSASGQLLF